MNEPTATLLISCPDSPGLVAKIANFIYANGGNIIHADRHTDFATSLFLIRLEWQLQGFNLPRETIATAFSAIAKPLNATWQLHFSDTQPKIAIWVTKQDRCWDLLWRHQAKELPGSIALIMSNHRKFSTVKDLIRQGKDLERLVLSRAVRLHLQNRVLVYDNKTVVFS